MLLLLLSRFSRVRLCVTPQTAAHQAPPSLGFSRQEHWSGLPFPSPMHGSEKWKWSCLVVSDLATPWTTAYQSPPSMGFSRQEYWSGVPLLLQLGELNYRFRKVIVFIFNFFFSSFKKYIYLFNFILFQFYRGEVVVFFSKVYI